MINKEGGFMYQEVKIRVFIRNAYYKYIVRPLDRLHNGFLKLRFPFLFVGEDDRFPEFCWLNEMPKGWKRRFGYKMCREIQRVIDDDNIKDFKTLQVKEKYGSLRWYFEGGNDKIQDIIDKYEDLSMTTCVSTGLPAKWMSRGWICPYSTIAKLWLERKQHMKFDKIGEDFFK